MIAGSIRCTQPIRRTLHRNQGRGEFTFTRRILEDKTPGHIGIAIMTDKKPDKAWTMTTFIAEDDAAILLFLKGSASQEAYDRAVARIKKDLPAGYRLDPECFSSTRPRPHS